ncbi:MAG: hypothetical protein HOP23_15140 [Methylococcaceae bacterium]|nr:hypothetical protein [Methylococcaceae bacterium]
MTINLLQVVSKLTFKTRREYIRVALTTASLLSSVLKTCQEITLKLK